VYPLAKRKYIPSISLSRPCLVTEILRAAFGFDMFSDIKRLQAMEQARDTGGRALTGAKLKLGAEKGRQRCRQVSVICSS